MPTNKTKTAIGRLLEELSWVGSQIRAYRHGGRGYENVLTVEAIQALDFLPRRAFFGAVLASATGADEARRALVAEVEDAETTVLPGNFYLIRSARTHQDGLAVQPDGLIRTPSCHVLLEAKRIRRNSFQAEQLAREYVLLLRDAREQRKTPLLLLLLGAPPPVAVKGHGKQGIEAAINLHLESVLARAEGDVPTPSEARSLIPDAIAWMTWQQVRDVVAREADAFMSSEPSVRASVQRLARSILEAVAWHGEEPVAVPRGE